MKSSFRRRKDVKPLSGVFITAHGCNKDYPHPFLTYKATYEDSRMKLREVSIKRVITEEEAEWLREHTGDLSYKAGQYSGLFPKGSPMYFNPERLKLSTGPSAVQKSTEIGTSFAGTNRWVLDRNPHLHWLCHGPIGLVEPYNIIPIECNYDGVYVLGDDTAEFKSIIKEFGRGSKECRSYVDRWVTLIKTKGLYREPSNAS